MTRDVKTGSPISCRDQLLIAARAAIERPAAVSEAVTRLMKEPGHWRDKTMVWASLAWSASGMQSVCMPHKYAAALMATDPIHDVDLKVPWHSFEVQVPGGIVAIDGVEPRSVIWCQGKTDGPGSLVFVWPKNISAYRFRTTNEFLKWRRVTSDVDEIGKSDSARRAHRMMVRLFLNVCLDIETLPAGAVRQLAGRDVRMDRVGRAVPNTIQIGRPLTIDCRQDIRDYVSGVRRSEPKVTTLVRGHWRNQAHGPANSLRKLMWIQPFYRGEGPMLVRPTRLGFGADEVLA